MTIKKIVERIALAIFIAGLVLGGCALAAQAGTPTPVNLIMLTLQPGTSFYDMAVALNTVISKDKSITLTVQSLTSINKPSFDMVQKGEAQLAFNHSNATYEALNGLTKQQGVGTFGGQAYPWVRLLAAGQKLYYGWITRPDTRIKTILDLKGKKVIGNFPTMVSNTLTAFASLRAYGLDPEKDVTMLKAENSVAAHDKLQDKEVDAICTSLGGAKLTELAASVGSFIVPFDVGKIGVVAKAVPGTVAAIIPGSYPGINVDTPCWGLIVELWGHRNLSDETAYRVIKAIYDREKDLAAMSPVMGEWNLKGAVAFPNQAVPYHSGAIKYYMEKRVWTSEHEARQKQLLAALPK